MILSLAFELLGEYASAGEGKPLCPAQLIRVVGKREEHASRYKDALPTTAGSLTRQAINLNG